MKVYFSFLQFVSVITMNKSVKKLNVSKSRRTVVEVCDELYREIRKLVLLNDLRIYEVANAIIEEFLRDEERVKVLIRRLKL